MMLLVIYLFVSLAYACLSEELRPSTFIGWGLYAFLTVCFTPIVSIPITTAACYFLGSIYGE